MEVVHKLVENEKAGNGENPQSVGEGKKMEEAIEKDETALRDSEQKEETNGDEAKAEVAAEVADSAQELDNGADV